MCAKRNSCDRCSESPHSVWFLPGSHACTSPDGARMPSGSVQVPVAATAALMHLRYPVGSTSRLLVTATSRLLEVHSRRGRERAAVKPRVQPATKQP